MFWCLVMAEKLSIKQAVADYLEWLTLDDPKALSRREKEDIRIQMKLVLGMIMSLPDCVEKTVHVENAIALLVAYYCQNGTNNDKVIAYKLRCVSSKAKDIIDSNANPVVVALDFLYLKKELNKIKKLFKED